MSVGFPLLAACAIAYALVSRRLATTIVTGPMIFVVLGVLFGPSALGWIDPEAEWQGVELLLEVTLVVLLFTDAYAVNTSRWREDAAIPARLLGLGLPLTILAGWGLALLVFPSLEVWEAGVLGVLLAPTDAALGQAVVSNPRVPMRIRQALNIESGLNDGIALPVFFVFLELASAELDSLGGGVVIREILAEVGVAIGAGLAIAIAGTFALLTARRRGWTDDGWSQLALGGLALLAWAAADELGGSGFIAAWVAGAATGHLVRRSLPGVEHFAEESGHALALLSFFVFGAIGVGPLLGDINWRLVVYAGLSLTAVRMVPVAISMLGSGVERPTVAYLGWFGPRGLASLILVLIVIRDADLAGTATITQVTIATVALSVLAHGVTAWRGSNAYADWFETHGGGDSSPEGRATHPVRLTRRFGSHR
jgi:NhaP-type Na+/H+ or K+/H+ antiporter